MPSSPVVVVLHPGEMGAAVASAMVRAHIDVRWIATGRSDATRARADAAGLSALDGIDALASSVDVVLSICPPGAATAVAEEVAAARFGGLYVDANAIAPATSERVAGIVARAGASYVDSGIVGSPPSARTVPRLYVSGDEAASVASLFEHVPDVIVHVMRGPLTSASALKLCYAAWTKGSVALLEAVWTAAVAHGVEGALAAEWASSLPDVAGRLQAAVASARKAWRWAPEMAEIAAMFAGSDLPDGFHRAAAEVFERLGGFKDGPFDEDLDLGAVTRAMLASGGAALSPDR